MPEVRVQRNKGCPLCGGQRQEPRSLKVPKGTTLPNLGLVTDPEGLDLGACPDSYHEPAAWAPHVRREA